MSGKKFVRSKNKRRGGQYRAEKQVLYYVWFICIFFSVSTSLGLSLIHYFFSFFSMIQEAHVGVGVFGKEGTQAVRSSDFAIRKFR